MLHRKQRFAASVVATLAAIPACTKGGGHETTSQIVHREDGSCWRTYSMSCPKGDFCNPPPPERVDCASGQPLPPTPVASAERD